MAREYRQNTPYEDINNGEGDEGKEKQSSHGNTRLPFGLCKKYGIPLPDYATPRMAWEALKRGTGLTPDQIYDRLASGKELPQKLPEQAREITNLSDNEIADLGDKSAENKQITFSNREEAYNYVINELGMLPQESLNNINEKSLIANVEQIANLDKRFGGINKNIHVTLSGKNMGRGTLACTGVLLSKAEVRELSLCESHYRDYDLCIEKELALRDKGHSVDFSDDFAPIATVTHEYGHIVFEKILAESDYVELVKAEIEAANKRAQFGIASKAARDRAIRKVRTQKTREIMNELVAIAKEIDPNVNMREQMSTYGNTDYEEYFAEAFLNSQGGRPNVVGKAMQKFLERRFNQNG